MDNRSYTMVWRIALTALAVFLCWSAFFFMAGENPLLAVYYILHGAFEHAEKTFSVLNKIFIYFLCALAYSVPAWTGMANVGTDGQLMLGGFTAAVLPLFFQTGWRPLNLVLVLTASAAAGGLWAYWPALLKVHFGINEVVTTLLGNYVITYFTEYMVGFPLRSKNAAVSRTAYLPDSFTFPVITKNLSAVIVLVLIALAAAEVFRKKTVAGYEYKLTGQNSFLARQGGVQVDKVKIHGMVAGGMIAGVTGGLMTCSLYYCYMTGFSADAGMSGMLVALMTGCIPCFSILIAGLFSVLQIGAIDLQMFTHIPSEITGVLESIMIFIIAAGAWVKLKAEFGSGRSGRDKTKSRQRKFTDRQAGDKS